MSPPSFRSSMASSDDWRCEVLDAPLSRGVQWLVSAEQPSRLAGGGLAERRLGGGETRDRHTERRARHIVEAGRMAERDRGGIAAVLAADAELDVLARLAAALVGDAD